MKIHIIQNLNYCSVYPGNLIRSVENLEKAASENNMSFIYVFPEEAEEMYWVKEMMDKGKVVYFKPKGKFNLFIFFLKLVRKYNVKIIHSHFWSINDCLSLKFVKMFCWKLKRIIHHHNHYFNTKNFFKEKIKRMIIKSEAHIGCSEEVTEQLVKVGFPATTCFEAENAIDFTRLDLVDFKNDTFSSDRKDVKRFLAFGFDYYRKGVDLIVKAFEKINKKYDNAELYIVFSINEGENINKIKSLIGPLPYNFHFLKPTDNIAQYYLNCDVFISASREEGFCYSIIEAAYCNCQSIISDIPGHRTDVPMIKIFKNENIEELFEKIEEVLTEDSSVTDDINAIQKDYILNKYGIDNWVKKIINVYFKIL